MKLTFECSARLDSFIFRSCRGLRRGTKVGCIQESTPVFLPPLFSNYTRVQAPDQIGRRRRAKSVFLGPPATASAYQTRFRDRTSVRKAVLAIHETILPRRLSLAGGRFRSVRAERRSQP